MAEPLAKEAGGWQLIKQDWRVGFRDLEWGMEGPLLPSSGRWVLPDCWGPENVSAPALSTARVVGYHILPSPAPASRSPLPPPVSTIFALHNRPLYTIKCLSLCSASVPGVGGGVGCLAGALIFRAVGDSTPQRSFPEGSCPMTDGGGVGLQDWALSPSVWPWLLRVTPTQERPRPG